MLCHYHTIEAYENESKERESLWELLLLFDVIVLSCLLVREKEEKEEEEASFHYVAYMSP